MKLQCWDSTQVTRQSVHEISAQLNTIVDHELFQSHSDFKKNCQHKSDNRDKSTTQMLYYNKSYYDKSFTEQQTSHYLLYHRRENNLWEFYQESDCDQSWNLNYLSVSEKVTTTTTQMFSESSLSHWHKDFITKDEIDVWKKVSLYIKCEVTDHWTNECMTEWSTAVIAAIKTNQWLAVNLQLVSLSIIDNISHLIAKQLEVNTDLKSSLKKEYSYIIDNSSQGNTITQTVINELSLQTELYEAQVNVWDNVIDLSESVILTITVYDTDSQLYCYDNHFLVISDNALTSFVLRLPFLVHANSNHEYNTGKFLWRKVRHITAHWVFTVSERKALKSVLHMNNLIITEHFIDLINLIADMKIKLSLLQYNKEYNNVYNILSLKYHDFTDIFQTAEKQSLSEKSSHDHVIDLELSQQPLFEKLYSMFSAELDVLKVYLDDAIKVNIIHKSISPAALPVMFVLKLNSSLQLIIDYRHLNSITIKNCYSLLLILNMLNCLQGTQKFTKLNCKNAYNWIQIKGEDEWKTVFWTQFRLFKYLIMLFNLTNASAMF